MSDAYSFDRPRSIAAGPIPVGRMVCDAFGYGVQCPSCPLILGTGSREWAVRGAEYTAHYVTNHLDPTRPLSR